MCVCILIVCFLFSKKISNGIQRLQETELTLDDMDQEDSTYTLEDR